MYYPFQDTWTTTTLSPAQHTKGAVAAWNLDYYVMGDLDNNKDMFKFTETVAPLVTHQTPPNIPQTHGATLTVTGGNLGTSDTSPTVSLGLTRCHTVKWTTATSISCALPLIDSPGTSVQTYTISNGRTSTRGFSYDAVVVTVQTPQNLPAEGGLAWVTGLNFGAQDLSPTLVIGNTLCGTTSWYSTTSVWCVQGAGSYTLPAVLFVQGLGSTTTAFLEYDPLFSLSGGGSAFNSPASGSAVGTLTGTSFGTEDQSATATVGSTRCSTTQWHSTTSMACVSPQGSSTALPMVLKINSLLWTETLAFSYSAPVVTHAASANSACSAGTSVTVSGTNYAAVDCSTTAAVGSTVCSTTAWVSSSSLVCQAADSGTSLELRAVVEQSGLVGTRTMTFSVDSPILTLVSVWNGPSSGSSGVVVDGMGFGSVDWSMTVAVGSTRCLTSSWTSPSSVTCISPAGSSGQLQAVATVRGISGTLSMCFTYSAAVVTSITVNGAISASGSLTVSGTEFGVVDTSLTSAVGSTVCSTTSWVSPSSMVCAVVRGDSLGLRAVVGVRGVLGTLTRTFTYDAAVVSSTPLANSPTSSSGVLSLAGMNFGFLRSSPSVVIGNSICRSSTWVSLSLLTCLVPSGLSVGLRVVIELGALVSTRAGLFSFASPVVSSVSYNGPSSGAASLTLLGTNLSVRDASLSAAIGFTVCASSAWASASSLVCAQPAGSSLMLSATTSVGSLVGTLLAVFTFDAPVASWAPSNSPSTGGARLTVIGFNLGSSAQSPTAAVGSTVCATTAWMSLSSVACVVRAGTSLRLCVRVGVDRLGGTLTNQFTYSSPAVSRVWTRNAAVSEASSVTISASELAGLDSSVSVALGSTLCLTTCWVSVTSALCLPASGSSVSLAARVEVGHLVGTLARSFSYDAAVVSALAPVNVGSSRGGEVTLLGHNFELVDASLSVRLGSSACLSTHWQSLSAVSCLSAPGASLRLTAVVAAATLMGTLTRLLSYSSPVVTFTEGNAPVTGHAAISICGANFGTVSHSPSGSVGASLCATIAWFSTTSMLCLTSSGSSTARRLAVEVLGLMGTATSVFSYDAAVVTRTAGLNSPTSGGTSLTIGGVNLGVLDASPSAALGSTLCYTTTWNSDSSARCLTPTGVSHSLAAVLTSGTLLSTLLRSFSYDSAVVTSVLPANGPMTGSFSISLAGLHFGATSTSPSATEGPVRCSTTHWLSTSLLTCLVPLASTRIQLSGALHPFSHDSPVVTQLSPRNQPSSGGSSLTVHGFHFGLTSTSCTVWLGLQQCLTSQWTSQTATRCRPTAGQESPAGFTASFDSVLSTLTAAFTFDSPVVSSASPNAPGSSLSGVTIFGTSLASSDESPSALLGSTRCATASWSSRSSVGCMSPRGCSLGHSAVVRVCGVGGTATQLFSYNAPVVTAGGPGNLAATSALPVSLSGTQMGVIDTSPSAAVGSTLCATTQWVSTTSLTCVTPPGGSVSLTAVVTCSLLFGTRLASYSYDAPVITHALPVNVPPALPASVTLVGLNFLVTNMSVSATVSATHCQTVSWLSSSALSCRARPRVGTTQPSVTVSLPSLTGTAVRLMTYNAPHITAFAGLNVPTCGGTSFTISGGNFGATNVSPSVRGRGVFTTRWTSTSSVVTLLAAPTYRISVHVVALVGTHTLACSYDATAITHVVAFNGPTSQLSITVVGIGFSLTNVSPSTTIGPSVCSTSSWTSHTSAACLLPAGSGHDLAAVATVAAAVGTATRMFSFDAPVVTTVNCFNTPSSYAPVTLIGTDFSAVDVSPTAALGRFRCHTALWSSQTSVLCQQSPAFWGSYATVAIQGLFATASALFSYSAPVLTHVFPFNVPLGVPTSITLVGTGYHGQDASVSASLGPTAVCGSTSWLSLTSVISLCKIQSVLLSASIEIQRVAGTLTQGLTLDAPVITAATVMNLPASGGASVTLLGESLGTLNASPSASIGAALCVTSAWISSTCVFFLSPVGAGATLSLASHLLNVIATHTRFMSYDAPVLTAVHAVNIPAEATGSLTLTGSSFQVYDASASSVLGETHLTTASWLSLTSIAMLSSPGVAHSTSFRVPIKAVTLSGIGTALSLFSYDAPLVSHLIPLNGPSTATWVTLQGGRFGMSSPSPSVTLGGARCVSTQWLSSTTLSCLNVGVNSAALVAPTVFLHSGTLTHVFTVDSPVLTWVEPANTPASGGVVTISANEFRAESSLRIGSTPCATATWHSVTSVQCRVGSGGGAQHTVSSAASVGPLFSYNAPALTSLFAPNSAHSGSSLTLLGESFQPSTLVTVAGTARTTQWCSSTSLLFSLAVRVQQLPYISFMAATLTAALTFDAPVVTQQSTNVPSTAFAISFVGVNFGVYSASLSITATASSVACGSVGWSSSTSFLCFPSAGFLPLSVKRSSVVVVESLGGTWTGSFSVDAPVVSSRTPGNVPVTGAPVTVHGTNFGLAHSSLTLTIGHVCPATQWLSSSAARCSLAYSRVRPSSVIVQAASTPFEPVSFDAPLLTALAPQELLMKGGTSATLLGLNFSPHDASPTVSISPTACVTTSWVSQSSLACLKGASVWTDRLTRLGWLPDVTATHPSLFSYRPYSCPPGWYTYYCDRPCNSEEHCSGRGSCDPNALCNCFPRVTGASCSSCIENYYTHDCSVHCSPAVTCSGHGTCSTSGTCECHWPFLGAACTQCEPNFYSGSAAACDVWCDAGTTCSGHGHCGAGGACECAERYGGSACSLCQTNYYTTPYCVVFCDALVTCHGRGSCDTSTGACVCEPQFEGRSCDQCAPARYGVACELTCIAETTCLGRGTCLADASCSCAQQYQGARCEDCAPQLFGDACAVTCHAPLTCFGHGACAVDGSCACEEHWDAGLNCQACSDGYFGPACILSCSSAVSCSGRGECSPVGACECIEPYAGPQCLDCAEHRFGEACLIDCNPSVRCHSHGACSSLGDCECDPGFDALVDCLSCVSSYFGQLCDVFCVPEATCSGHGRCTRLGACLCTNNFGGLTCSACIPQFYGADCTVFCHDGSCPKNHVCSVQGQCVCGPQFTGVDCLHCASNFFGDSCSTYCGPETCGAGVCDALLGLPCVCRGNFTGDDCRACKAHHYGTTCDKFCHAATMCHPLQHCVDGECRCKAPSRAGSACEQCSLNYYGRYCSVFCTAADTCSGHGVCDSEGRCVCDANFQPPLCAVCVDHHFGLDCSLVCDAATTCSGNGICTLAAECYCHPSFTGLRCDACSEEKFGSACDVTCVPRLTCSGHGTCGVTGQCSCADRFVGLDCSACLPDWFGTDCQVYCLAPITCSAHGSCSLAGACDCRLPWAGPTCGACTQNYFGSSCQHFCSAETCSGHGQCNSVGDCECMPGFAPPSCGSCQPSHYTLDCSVFCSAALTCAGHGVCRSQDGKCECERKFTGRSCEDCVEPDVYGADCTLFCSRIVTCNSHGSCNRAGSCECSGNWVGVSCLDCQPAHYGANCQLFCDAQSVCHGHGRCLVAASNSGEATVVCSCDEGFDPSLSCSICIVNRFGPTCSLFCDIVLCSAGGGGCHPATGECVCPSSFAGADCRSCKEGLYGARCDMRLNLRVYNDRSGVRLALPLEIACLEDGEYYLRVAHSLPNDVVAVSLSALPSFGSVSVDTSVGYVVTYAPQPKYSGVDAFTLQVTVAGEPLLLPVNVTVHSIERVYEAIDDFVVALQDESMSISVTANDKPNGVNLRLAGTSVPARGSAVVDAALGTVIYTPNPGYVGNDTFLYVVQSADSSVSASARVHVAVKHVAKPPAAVDDAGEMFTDLPLELDVLRNDVDARHDYASLKIVSVVLDSAEPVLSVATSRENQWLLISALNGFVGKTSVTYTVSDGELTSQAVVTLVVKPKPAVVRACDPPCAASGACNDGTCVCRPGYTYSDCSAPVFRVAVTDVPRTSEVRGRANITVSVRVAPTAAVVCSVFSSDKGEGVLLTEWVRFEPTLLEQVVVVQGVPDYVDDGDQMFSVFFGACVSDDARFQSVEPTGFSVMNLDIPYPDVYAVVPPVSVAVGGDSITLRGSKFELGCLVYVATVLVSEYNSTLLAAVNSTINPMSRRPLQLAQDAQPLLPPTGRFHYTFWGPQRITFLTPSLDAGYHSVGIRHTNGAEVEVLEELLYTNDCPEVGMIGWGSECHACPDHADCPGGNRAWPHPGYWTFGEFTGELFECVPKERCLGGRHNLCKEGHTGVQCSSCVDGHFLDDLTLFCEPCDGGTERGLYVQLIVALFVLLFLTQPLVVVQRTIHYWKLAQAIRMVGFLGAVKHLPTSVMALYSSLSLFTLDVSFVQPACAAAMPAEETLVSLYWLNFTNVAAIVLVLLALPLVALTAILFGAHYRAVVTLGHALLDRFFSGFLAWFSVVQLILLYRSFQITNCASLAGVLVLRDNPTLQCFGAQHLSAFVAAVLVLSVMLAVLPLLFFAVVRRARANGALYQRRWRVALLLYIRDYRAQYAVAFPLAEWFVNATLGFGAVFVRKSLLQLPVVALPSFLLVVAGFALRPGRTSLTTLLLVSSQLFVVAGSLFNIAITAELAAQSTLVWLWAYFLSIGCAVSCVLLPDVLSCARWLYSYIERSTQVISVSNSEISMSITPEMMLPLGQLGRMRASKVVRPLLVYQEDDEADNHIAPPSDAASPRKRPRCPPIDFSALPRHELPSNISDRASSNAGSDSDEDEDTLALRFQRAEVPHPLDNQQARYHLVSLNSSSQSDQQEPDTQTQAANRSRSAQLSQSNLGLRGETDLANEDSALFLDKLDAVNPPSVRTVSHLASPATSTRRASHYSGQPTATTQWQLGDEEFEFCVPQAQSIRPPSPSSTASKLAEAQPTALFPPASPSSTQQHDDNEGIHGFVPSPTVPVLPLSSVSKSKPPQPPPPPPPPSFDAPSATADRTTHKRDEDAGVCLPARPVSSSPSAAPPTALTTHHTEPHTQQQGDFVAVSSSSNSPSPTPRAVEAEVFAACMPSLPRPLPVSVVTQLAGLPQMGAPASPQLLQAPPSPQLLQAPPSPQLLQAPPSPQLSEPPAAAQPVAKNRPVRLPSAKIKHTLLQQAKQLK